MNTFNLFGSDSVSHNSISFLFFGDSRGMLGALIRNIWHLRLSNHFFPSPHILPGASLGSEQLLGVFRSFFFGLLIWLNGICVSQISDERKLWLNTMQNKLKMKGLSQSLAWLRIDVPTTRIRVEPSLRQRVVYVCCVPVHVSCQVVFVLLWGSTKTK